MYTNCLGENVSTMLYWWFYVLIRKQIKGLVNVTLDINLYELSKEPEWME